MNKFKLLFVDFELPFLVKDVEYPVGGACVRQYALAKGITSLGHEVGILTWKGAKEYVRGNLEFDLIESYTLSDGNQKLRWFYHIYPKLYKAVKSFRPDFIFQKCAGVMTGAIALVSKQLNIPFIYVASNDIDADGRYRDRLRFTDIKLYEYGIRNAAKIIAQNTYQKREFLKKWKNKKIEIVHNPFYYDGTLPEIKPLNKRTYIAWIGIFQYQKNLPALLDIIKKSPDIEFRIAGTFSNTCPGDIKNVVQEIANCSNVKMMGYIKRNDIIPFLNNALALLNTSHYEGFSNTFLESFAAGTPVITTLIDPDNIITTNGIGIVTQNYEEIPSKLNEILHRGDYIVIAERCRDYVFKHHDPVTIAEIFMESITNN